MSDKDNGGPAFPHTLDMVSGGNARGGMTLRDYFAAAALQGLYANPQCIANSPESDALFSYRAADAMLAERSKP